MNRKISSLLVLMVLGATLGIHAGGDQKPSASASSSSSSFVNGLSKGVGATITLVSVSADGLERALAFLPNHPYLSLAGTAVLCYLFKPRIDSLVTSMNPSLLKTTLSMFFGTSRDLLELRECTAKTQTALTVLDQKVVTLISTLSTEQQGNFTTLRGFIAEAQEATTKNLALLDKKIEEKATKSAEDMAALTERTERLQQQVENLQIIIETQKQSLALLPTIAHDISNVRTNLQRAAGSRWMDSLEAPIARPQINESFEQLLQRAIATPPSSSTTRKAITTHSSSRVSSASSSSAGGPAKESSSEEDDSTSEETVSPTHAAPSASSSSDKSSPDTTDIKAIASSSSSAEKPLSSERKSPATRSSRGSDAFTRNITGGRFTSASALPTQAARKKTKKDDTCSHQ